MTENRLDRESKFHDEAFTDNTRSVASAFYAIATVSRGLYHELICAHLEDGQRALEYGCGKGGLGLDLANKGILVDAIDISPAGVDMGREAAKGLGKNRICYQVMNAESLDFPDRHFDVVFGSGILHHLDFSQALNEVRRVLKTKGRAFFFEPLGHNFLIELYRRLTPKMRSTDEHPLCASDLEKLASYFGLVKTTYFHLVSLAAIPLRGLPGFDSALRFLHAVDRALFSLLPFLRRQAWIVVIEVAEPIPAASSAPGSKT